MLPLLLLLAVEPACLRIDGPQVTAQDLAARVPAFARLAPDTPLAPSPVFGARRELTVDTLNHWLRLHKPDQQLRADEGVCLFRQTAQAVDIHWEAELREALDSLFHFKPAPGELILHEHTLGTGANGKMVLERSGLFHDSRSNSYLWRGRLGADAGGAPVRIRFSITRQTRRLIAAKSLPAGRLLTDGDTEWQQVPYKLEPTETRADDLHIEGKVLRRSLPKGTPILALHLTEAPIIFPGDTVELISRAGQTAIRTQAVARNKARLGDPVIVAMDGNKLLRAIAVAPARVEIESPNNRRKQ
jgi:flagella basal body P-ring formation protein FlgA